MPRRSVSPFCHPGRTESESALRGEPKNGSCLLQVPVPLGRLGRKDLSEAVWPFKSFDRFSNSCTIRSTSSSRSKSRACDLLFCRASLPLNGPLSKLTMYEEAEVYVAFLSFSGTASGKSSPPRSSVRDWKPGTWSKRTSPVLRCRLKSVSLLSDIHSGSFNPACHPFVYLVGFIHLLEAY